MQKKMTKKSFKVTGMGCAGCAARVNTVLNSLNGVKHASVSFVSGRTSIEFDENICDTESMMHAVSDAGTSAGGSRGEQDKVNAGRQGIENC